MQPLSRGGSDLTRDLPDHYDDQAACIGYLCEETRLRSQVLSPAQPLNKCVMLTKTLPFGEPPYSLL
jgi:hypothetical protein